MDTENTHPELVEELLSSENITLLKKISKDLKIAKAMPADYLDYLITDSE